MSVVCLVCRSVFEPESALDDMIDVQCPVCKTTHRLVNVPINLGDEAREQHDELLDERTR